MYIYIIIRFIVIFYWLLLQLFAFLIKKNCSSLSMKSYYKCQGVNKSICRQARLSGQAGRFACIITRDNFQMSAMVNDWYFRAHIEHIIEQKFYN